ncbi:MAG: hypothetical protein V4568_19640 [Pseudomonadota bacterium]
MPFEDQILQVIKSVMPANADIRVVPGMGAVNLGVSWKLHDDPERPNKMSKTIAICVSHEAAQDFANASQVNQASSYQRISSFLAQKLAHFDPTHNAPKHEIPPIEQWVINTHVVNG